MDTYCALTISQVILTTGLPEWDHFAKSTGWLLEKAKWDLDKIDYELFTVIMEILLPNCSMT